MKANTFKSHLLVASLVHFLACHTLREAATILHFALILRDHRVVIVGKFSTIHVGFDVVDGLRIAIQHRVARVHAFRRHDYIWTLIRS